MKTFFASLVLVTFGWLRPIAAQEDKTNINIDFNTRFDFQYDKPKVGDQSSGFHGRYLNLMVKGNINKYISFNFRQRLNKRIEANDIFSATDWLYISCKPSKNWEIAGGKQVVAIGGYEYDAAPINVYYASMFWNNIACYQFGVSGKYISNSGEHSLLFQICNSPAQGMSSSTYAYNLMWNGKIGWWSTIWSLNMIETQKGEYAQYIALGNRFDFDKFNLELDLMQRSYEGNRFWLNDFSIIAKAEFKVCRYLNIIAKGGYERFHPGRMGVSMTDIAVKEPFYGIGVDVFPIKSYPSLRLHAMWDINHGGDGKEIQEFMAGATWNCNLLRWNKK